VAHSAARLRARREPGQLRRLKGPRTPPSGVARRRLGLRV
jgi:hypothetical protein